MQGAEKRKVDAAGAVQNLDHQTRREAVHCAGPLDYSTGVSSVFGMQKPPRHQERALEVHVGRDVRRSEEVQPRKNVLPNDSRIGLTE